VKFQLLLFVSISFLLSLTAPAQSIEKVGFQKNFLYSTYDTLNFEFVQFVDDRENKNYVASYYRGLFETPIILRPKRDLEFQLNLYLTRSLHYTKKDTSNKVLALIKKFMVRENEDSIIPGAKAELKMEAEIDYYLKNGKQLAFIDKISKTIDTIVKVNKYDIADFNKAYFEEAIPALDKKIGQLKSNNVISSINEESKEIEGINKNPLKDDDSNEANNSNSTTLQTIEELPEKEELNRLNFGFGFERFSGTNANGFRLRFISYDWKFGSKDWIPLFAFDTEFMQLNESVFDEKNSEIFVDYSYFALGLGTLKPLTNYFFLELQIKLGGGREIEDYGPFEQVRTNGYFGFFLNQRMHFILGKRFGIFLSGGTYQNFYSGTNYLKSDFGVSFGGGIKF